MASRNHIIRRQVIELDVPSVENAWEIQERVSELYKYQLLQVLEEIFDAIAPDGEVLRIDRLEVDIGKVNAGTLEEEVVAKVREQVEQRLMELRHKADFRMEETPGESSAARRQSAQSKTDFLLHFLKTGTAPWWRNRGDFGSIVSILEELIAERPAWIRKQLLPLLEETSVRKRIVTHLNDEQLAKLVSLMESSFASRTKRLLQLLHEEQMIAGRLSEHAEVATVAEKKRRRKASAFRFERIRREVFRAQLWEAVLAKISGEDVPVQSLLRDVSFVAGKEEFPSAKSALEEFTPVAGVTPLLRETTTAAFRKLKQSDLVLRRKKKKQRPSSEQENSPQNNAQDIFAPEKTTPSIEDSTLAAEEESTDINEETIPSSRRKKRVEQDSPANEREENSENASDAANGKKRVVKSARKKRRKKPLAGEGNFAGEAEESFSDELLMQGDEAEEQEKGADAKTKEETEASALSRKNGEQLSREKILSRKSKEHNKAEEQHTDEAEDEEIYEPAPEDLSDFVVDNAGLVLLWPYLGHFFGALGLVKDRQFVDEAAAHRAVHLLQYMAEGGALEYEEHDLVLNKILCGLEVTEPIDMQFAITDEEKEEVQGLLEAVIQNWKGIGRTSVNGLQVTFLQKEGSLKRQGEGWHLGIERKTVDVLLDRLPWTISIIRLPWVEETIFVEW